MKKIVLIIWLVFVSFGNFWVVWGDSAAYDECIATSYEPAACSVLLENNAPNPEEVNNWWWTSNWSTTLKVRVTEKVPWANCVQAKNSNWSWETLSDWSPVYECTVERWFGTVKSTIWQIIKYFTYITWLAWVLYIIINGIMLSMSWLEQSMKDTAKKNIKKVLIWLLLLLLSGVFLNMIAPWIYQ